MTPRENFETVLRGGTPDYVPFVFREGLVPDPELRREIMEHGACALITAHAYSTEMPSVDVTEESWTGSAGRERRRMTFRTPVGELTAVDVKGDESWWMEEPPFKDASDYAALRFLLEHQEYEPTYERFAEEDRLYDGTGIARAVTEKHPFFELMHNYMGIDRFSYEWNDNRGSILGLYDIMLENRRKRLELLAGSPAQFAVIDGNIEMSVVGLERFRDYYSPVIREACDLLHRHGKKTGLHLDSENRQFIGPVSLLPVDFIESFTPPPDCDLTIREGLEGWPEMVLLVNFPSSVHLRGIDAVVNRAEEIVGEAWDTNRLVMGIHEDVPRFDTVLPLVRTTCGDNRSPVRSQR